MEQNKKPLSSEVLVFVGAGATADLGMPQTLDQENSIIVLSGLKKQNESLEERIKESVFGKCTDEEQKRLVLFFKILGDEYSLSEIVPNDNLVHNVQKYCNELLEKKYNKSANKNLIQNLIIELRKNYDWQALKAIVRICPFDEKESNYNGDLIRSLYSILDKRILSHQGLDVLECGEKIYLDVMRLQGARNCLTMLISLMFGFAWERLITKDREKLKSYEKFADAYVKLMQKEADDFSHKYTPYEKEFFLNSVSFVSFNFEAIFMWLLMRSDAKFNKEKEIRIYDKNGNPPRELRQFLEFGSGIHFRSIEDKEKIDGDLSCDESTAFQMNKGEKGRYYERIGRFYFAHGSCHWRECPVCGRLTVYFGDEEEVFSKSLFPPFPLDMLKNCKHRSYEKQTVSETLRFDTVACVHCGHPTETRDAPMIMQTLHKGIPTSFLEEIQREVKVQLANARHIILFGYSLPLDDVIWQQAFAEAIKTRTKGNEAYCTVVVGKKDKKEWLYAKELENYVEKAECTDSVKNAVLSAWKIFGRKYVRAYTGGIPYVWRNAEESDLKEIFYPRWVNWKGTRIKR